NQVNQTGIRGQGGEGSSILSPAAITVAIIGVVVGVTLFVKKKKRRKAEIVGRWHSSLSSSKSASAAGADENV
ncbi:unnamed protein product, partial [Didymodactylos carnosus]